MLYMINGPIQTANFAPVLQTFASLSHARSARIHHITMIRSAVFFITAIVSVVLHGAEGRINGHCRNTDGVGSMTWRGICVKVSKCDEYGGITLNGACPDDPKDVKCCFINTCDPRKGIGYSYCDWTSHACPLGNPGAGTWRNSESSAPWR